MPPKAGADAQSTTAAADDMGRLKGRATRADAPTDEPPGRQQHFQSATGRVRAQRRPRSAGSKADAGGATGAQLVRWWKLSQLGAARASIISTSFVVSRLVVCRLHPSLCADLCPDLCPTRCQSYGALGLHGAHCRTKACLSGFISLTV